MVWAVTPIRYGVLSPIPSTVLGWRPPDAQAFSLPSLGYLLHNADLGRYCLVDLGPSSPQVSRSHGRTVVLDAEWCGVGAGLRAAGVDPRRVDTVIVTHAHWDHSYGAGELPGAEIVVQRADLVFGADEHGEQSRFFDRAGGLHAPDSILRVIDGDIEIAEGLRCIRLGGHTPGSQAILIDTAHGLVACLGDLAHRYENILGLTAGGPAHPSGLLVDHSQWAVALERLAAMSVTPLLAHDERSRLVLRHQAKLTGHGGEYRIRADDWELVPDRASLAAVEGFRAA
jgi:N-acyl homoserine lactone hydrolase